MRSWAPQACLSAWREPPDEALVSLHDVHTFATARYSQSVSHSLRRLWAVARRCVIAGATAAPAGGCARLVFSGVVRRVAAARPPHRWSLRWWKSQRGLCGAACFSLLVGVCSPSRVGSPPQHLGRRDAASVEIVHNDTTSLRRRPGASARAACGPRRRLLLEVVAWRRYDSYLVDPASSHMLVSKIKPCMSKYKLLYTVKLRMAH